MKKLIILLLSIGLLLIAFTALAQPPPAIVADQAILLCEKGAMIPPTLFGPILAQTDTEKGSSLNSPDQALAETDFKNFGRVSIAELDRHIGNDILLANDPTEARGMIATAYMVSGKDTAI
jgi:hypothetical protein